MSDKAMAGGAGGMGIDVSIASIPAGEVTFTVTNASTQIVHEMLVVPVTPSVLLPMTADNAVDEDRRDRSARSPSSRPVSRER